jgi:hypothetical protein
MRDAECLLWVRTRLPLVVLHVCFRQLLTSGQLRLQPLSPGATSIGRGHGGASRLTRAPPSRHVGTRGVDLRLETQADERKAVWHCPRLPAGAYPADITACGGR